MPVVTEHVLYNGYETGGQARKFWNEAYNFIFVDLKNRTTGRLFGSYPPVYRQRNIPVFRHSISIPMPPGIIFTWVMLPIP